MDSRKWMSEIQIQYSVNDMIASEETMKDVANMPYEFS